MEDIPSGPSGANAQQLVVGEVVLILEPAPTPSPKNKGKTCIEQDLGPNMESEECNTQDCRKYNVFTSLHLLLLFLNIITKLCTVNMLLILACNTLVKGKFNCYKRSFSIFISVIEVAFMPTMFT